MYVFPVNPKFLVKDTVESFMNVKTGDAIHVRIPFEVSIAFASNI